MSKRLQILIDERELRDIRRAAKRSGQTVSEWARQAFREARRSLADGEAVDKLAVVRAGSLHAFPTADVDVMLAEIEAGYLDPVGDE